MNITKKDQTKTSVTLVIEAKPEDTKAAKQKALKTVGKNLKIDGFRKGKAPESAILKAADPSVLANEFLNEVVPTLVGNALDNEKLSTVIPPSVNVTKFVPFSTLEIEVLAEFLGDIKLADYKKVKKTRPDVKVTKEDIDGVTKRIQMDMAEREEVDRASKDGDQVWIDFSGVGIDGEAIDGASGEDYPLALGSNTFIPGFEDNLVGVKKDDVKEFTLTFPKEYGVKALQNKKVTFTCTVKKVQSVTVPEIDDETAKKIGPYENAKALMADIEKQVKADKIHKADLEVESEVMRELADMTDIEMPEGMITQQLNRMIDDQKSNLHYRGQSYEQWLKDQKLTEEAHLEQIKPEAISRLKGGIVLSEIAKAEGIELTEEEIDAAVQQYKVQYASDPKMAAELENPSARRDIAARILTDRTLARLKELIYKK